MNLDLGKGVILLFFAVLRGIGISLPGRARPAARRGASPCGHRLHSAYMRQRCSCIAEARLPIRISAVCGHASNTCTTRDVHGGQQWQKKSPLLMEEQCQRQCCDA